MTTRALFSLATATALGATLQVAPVQAGTFDDVFNEVFVACVGCHGPGGGAQSGGLTANPWTADSFRGALLNRAPSSSTSARQNGKLRVHPYFPWNSFVVDKLAGDLKDGEGDPMTKGGVGLAFTCPGVVDRVANWILQGAPASSVVVEGDEAFVGPDGKTLCDRPQPEFVAPEVPADGVQLAGNQISVQRVAKFPGPREAETMTMVTLEDSVAVGRIEIVASPNTEYVALSRMGDATPFAVATGDSLDLQLPEGVAFTLNAGDMVHITQRIRNDYWIAPSTTEKPTSNTTREYVNESTGDVVVNLHAAASVTTEATLLGDTTATDNIFVAPHSVGAAGGSVSLTGSEGLVTIWSDQRATEVGFLAGGETLQAVAPNEYVLASAVAGPGGTLSYGCVHSNGVSNNVDVSGTSSGNTTVGNYVYTAANARSEAAQVDQLIRDHSRPLRWGCAESTSKLPTALPVTGNTYQPAGSMGNTAVDCAQSSRGLDAPFSIYKPNDCAGIGPESCQPANLVGGEGVNDGRCTLVGLVW